MSHITPFLNPLENPILIPIIIRVLLVFVLGFFLLLILKKGRLKGIWKNELGKRYLSWIVIALIYLIFVFIGGYLVLIFLFIVMSLAIYEAVEISKLPKSYAISLYSLALVSIFVSSFYPENFYMLPLIYFLIFFTISINRNDKKGLAHLSLSLFLGIWIIFALSHFVLLGHLNHEIDNTRSLLFLIGFTVPFADIGAYLVGKRFSKTFLNKYKIARNISPRKTYVGIIGDILGAFIGILIMYFVINAYFSIYEMIILAVIIGLFASVGDLTGSLFKRYYKVKDSSSLIPGHGGILDRINSTLRVIVVV